MKIMFLSDVHGSLKYAKIAMRKFEEEKCDKLVLLGDILSHGGKLSQIEDFDMDGVAKLLNKYKDKIVAVRGNCDNDCDNETFLKYPVADEFARIKFNDRIIFATHGHIYDEYSLPKLNSRDIFIHGHFHIPMAKVIRDVYCLNPGSITLPRGNSKNSYAILTDDKFTIKDIDGNVVKEIVII